MTEQLAFSIVAGIIAFPALLFIVALVIAALAELASLALRR